VKSFVSSIIPVVPSSFANEVAFAGRWFHWRDVAACFWPGPGGRSHRVNPLLAPVLACGGVYLLAWCDQAPEVVLPSEYAVVEIGETGHFKSRMNQFRTSAGFLGERDDGHSTAWKWPQGRHENLWVTFFEMGEGLPRHLALGLRKWMEAVAFEEHRQANGSLPLLNVADEVVEFD
jgi:hypothetical protein